MLIFGTIKYVAGWFSLAIPLAKKHYQLFYSMKSVWILRVCIKWCMKINLCIFLLAWHVYEIQPMMSNIWTVYDKDYGKFTWICFQSMKLIRKNIPTNFIDVVVYEIYMSTVYAINMRMILVKYWGLQSTWEGTHIFFNRAATNARSALFKSQGAVVCSIPGWSPNLQRADSALKSFSLSDLPKYICIIWQIAR